MKKFVLFTSCALLAIPFAGCQQEVTSPQSMSKVSPVQYTVTDQRVDRTLANITGSISDLTSVRALNPGDYVCNDATPISDWFLNAAFEIELPNLITLLNGAADLVPTYATLLFETSSTPQYFGYNGEYTQVMTKTEKDVKRFWDISSSQIQVLAMHGSVLLDETKVAATYRAVFGLSPAGAAFWASQVHNAVATSAAANGGNHPLFTFNSVAFHTASGAIPDKIIMGDGILAGYTALGFGDVAPQAIFAHEFAHHIQYQNGYFDDAFATAGSGAEQTQYTELMADAMSAYFLTHARGTAMNRKRVAQFLEVFYEIGDCAFDSDGHHGTPNQRMRAANFGFEMADKAQKQGHIMSSAAFHDAFVAAYPAMVAPDAN